MLKTIYYLLPLLILGLLLSGCTSNKTEVNLGQDFSLSLGQTAVIKSENLEVKFEKVLEDSRCATGVVCIWAGRVSCQAKFTQPDSSYQMVLTESGLTDQNTQETYQEYKLSFRVEPYPEAGKTISPGQYRLMLNITK
jgi:hypothetical protein